MKTNTSIVIAICAIAVLSTGAWAAKGEGKKNKAEPAKAQASETYVKFDTDANGTLSDTEKAAMKKDFEANKTECLKAYDTDSDGKLSDTEIAAIPATKPAEAPAAKAKKGKKK